MRFSTVHLACTYLIVLASALPVLTSQDTTLLTAFAFIAACALSLIWGRDVKLQKKLQQPWTALTVAFLLYLLFLVWRGGSVIAAGVDFLLFVLVNKLFNLRDSRDYLQTYAVSFLMLVAATTLNNGLIFAACFVLYVVLLTWSLLLLHLRREIEASDAERGAHRLQSLLVSNRVVDRPLLVGSSAVSLGILLGAVGIFTFFPRIGFGLLVGPQRSKTAFVGFSDKVELGHHGRIRDNPQVVMRVVFPGNKKPPMRLLWRGSAHDYYEGGSWSHGPQLRGRLAIPKQAEGLYLMNNAPGLTRPVNAARLRDEMLRQEIYLEPLETAVLFGADRPVALELIRKEKRIPKRPVFSPRRGPLGEMRAHRRRSSALRYVVYSHIDRPSAATLRQQAQPLTKWRFLDRFVQLPKALSPRVRQLAEHATRGETTVYDRVIAIQRYLRKNYRYTLDLKHAPGKDPLSEFLFESKAGHCEYFATAMTIMLRTLGIHARNVNGFAGGQWNRFGRYLALRHGDAHTWSEVLFANVGWVSFDATPPAAVRRAGPAAAGLTVRLRQMIDALRLRWLRYVIEYDLAKQVSLVRSIGGAFSASSKRTARRDGKQTSAPIDWKRIVPVAAALLVFGIFWWRRRRRGDKTLAGTAAATRPAAQIYRRMLRHLARRGLSRPQHQTPQEFCRQLQRDRMPGADAVGRLTIAYYQLRYGIGRLSAPRQQQLLAAMRQDLAKLRAMSH